MARGIPLLFLFGLHLKGGGFLNSFSSQNFINRFRTCSNSWNIHFLLRSSWCAFFIDPLCQSSKTPWYVQCHHLIFLLFPNYLLYSFLNEFVYGALLKEIDGHQPAGQILSFSVAQVFNYVPRCGYGYQFATENSLGGSAKHTKLVTR